MNTIIGDDDLDDAACSSANNIDVLDFDILDDPVIDEIDNTVDIHDSTAFDDEFIDVSVVPTAATDPTGDTTGFSHIEDGVDSENEAEDSTEYNVATGIDVNLEEKSG